MSKKLTNEDIDQRLAGRNIRRLEDYPGSGKILMLFQCLVPGCCYEWRALTTNIVNGERGCPKCVGLLPLTNAIVDQRLEGKNIKRLGNIINNRTPIKFLCEVCRHGENGEWKVGPKNPINGYTGCPKCAKCLPLNNEIVDQKLKGRNIKRLGDYNGIDIPIAWQCLNCNYGSNNEWKTSPNNILNGEKGCPICKVSKNEKLISSTLKEMEIPFEPHKSLKTILITERQFYVDFYLPQYNTIIEYNGEQHYSPVCFGSMSIEQSMIRFDLQKERDATVQRLCDNNNVQLVWIDGRKYTNSKLKKYMIDELIPRLKSSKTR